MQERFFGFSVKFFHYPTFVSLFEEIFIGGLYDFSAHTASPYIVACGSNIGLDVLYFKGRYPSASIMSFEPDRDTFAVLDENVRNNRLTHVTLKRAAVGAESGTAMFYFDPDHPGLPLMSLRKERMAKSQGREEVVVERLSELIQGEVDFLKLDIEGAEGDVIHELALRGKLRMVRAGAIEYHHHIIANEDALSRLLTDLESNGLGYTIECPSPASQNSGQYQDIQIQIYRK